jgi:hypothetical protein
MGRRPVTYIIVALMLACAVSACASREDRAVAAVAKIWYPKNGREVATVGAGPLEEGTAVLCDDAAAFWVKDGKVYVVNERAREFGPELEQAPSEITYDDVKRVAE